MRCRSALALASALLVAYVLAGAAAVASAQTFQLTSCAWSELSAAVTTANSNNQDDTINLKQNCTYVLPSQIDVTYDGGHTLTINGFGSTTLSHPGGTNANNSIAIQVEPGTQLTLNRVSVTAACASSSQCPAPGPATIVNIGTLALNGSTVSNGSSMSGIENADYNPYPATLTLSRSTISNNGGWGISAGYGTTTWVIYSQISGNKGGGIIAAGNGTVHVSGSTVSGNTTTIYQCQGAGINNGGNLTVFASTITGNVTHCNGSYGRGGGLWNSGTAWISDSTIANNTSGSGGGIYQYPNGGQVSVLWSTLSANVALYATTGGNIRSDEASGVLLKGSILANGDGSHDCLHNVSGAIVDEGYNIADDTTCAVTSAHHSLGNTPAGLDPNGLQNNGGPTQTIALVLSSPAVDFVPVSATGPAPTKLDQRLLPRPDASETFTDAGAYESQDG